MPTTGVVVLGASSVMGIFIIAPLWFAWDCFPVVLYSHLLSIRKSQISSSELVCIFSLSIPFGSCKIDWRFLLGRTRAPKEATSWRNSDERRLRKETTNCPNGTVLQLIYLYNLLCGANRRAAAGLDDKHRARVVVCIAQWVSEWMQHSGHLVVVCHLHTKHTHATEMIGSDHAAKKRFFLSKKGWHLRKAPSR